ncbi:cytochrome P450 [Auricularia subglabra TFB-10046 SS5]|nr:cytochrome P450 [Auricularia subglabra TFB-10046 SS5]
MDATFALLALGLLGGAAFWVLAGSLTSGRRLPLPPGPAGQLFIGNLLDAPTAKEWLTYAAWAKTYGNIISMRIFGQTIVVLNSAQDVRELFVARASNYSERIHFTMVVMTGWREGTATISPGEKFRAMRRFMTQILGPHAVKGFLPVQEAEITSYLRRILDHPEDLRTQTRRLVGTIVLKLIYGYTVAADDDPFVEQAESALRIFHAVAAPGWMVDMFPSLRHLPSWLPGMEFKRKARVWRKLVADSRRNTLEYTRTQIASGKPTPCFAADLLADDERMKDEPFFAMVLADLYSAASDTTVTALLSFFIHMAMHPDMQQRAQREIDNITRGERLPTLDDRDSLPYVQAIIKEVHRWHPVAPMGIPHCAAADDEYKGHRIPKGAIVFANVWSILRNPETYPDPATFRPERHLERAELSVSAEKDPVNEDPTKYDFGFGSRQCPGRHLAQSTLFLVVASVLATCTISDAVDKNGAPLTPTTVQYMPGIVSQPAPFSVAITARSHRAQDLLIEK